ncbi:MAG: class I SAM-dependent methyltransferase [Verrucomicrobia bacterium]|nr:class I SAM-dependent methyltransferase [Verrucomicrobiota bacterium]
MGKEDVKLWDGQNYHAHSRIQEWISQQLLKDLKTRFASTTLPGATILDIGCGSGHVSHSILETFKGVNIIGIDPSADMIAYAQHHFPHLNFRIDRAEELKTIADRSVDAIVSFTCLHWVHDQASAFRNMYRVLKPGGWVGLIFAAETNYPDPVGEACHLAMAEEPIASLLKPYPKHQWNFAYPEDIKKDIEAAGFVIEEMKMVVIEFAYDSPAQFRDSMANWFQQIKVLPKPLQEKCLDRVVELYLQKTADKQPKDGKCVIFDSTLQFILRRPQ